MQRLFTLLTVLFCATLSAFAQGDSPYALFGYEGKVLRTPQERQQRMMLVVPNPDTTAAVAKVGLDPAKQRYYLFDKQNQILDSATLAATTVSRFLSVDPLAPKYPWYTPYQFAGNTPIQAIDLDGLEPYYGGQAYSGYDLFDNNRDGKVSEGEKTGGYQAMVFYGIAALDAFVFKGKLTSTYMAYTLGDAMDHGEKSLSAKRAGDKQTADAQSNQSKEAYTQFGIGLATMGVGHVAGKLINRAALRNTTANEIRSNTVGAARAGFSNEKNVTAIGRMEDLVKFDGNPNVDTWHKSGRIPGPGEPQVTWPENRAWLDERIARGDEFWISTNPSSLPPAKGGYVPGTPNGYFTARELEYLNSRGIKPKYKP
jgi:hypothetical protein